MLKSKHIFISLIAIPLLVGCTPTKAVEIPEHASTPLPITVEVTRIIEVTPERVTLKAPLPFHMETMAYESVKTGRSYNIYISLPIDYQHRFRTYPSIYVLDGDLLFGTTKEIIHSLSVDSKYDSIVVGIGYEVDSFNVWRYLRDKDVGRMEDYEAFTLFLLEELIPYIDSEYRTDPNDRTLIGYSLTGLFSLAVMFRSPDTFNKIIATSPSLQVDDRGVFLLEEEYARDHRQLPVKLYLSVGGLEEGDTPMVSNLLDLSSILESREYSEFSLDVEVFEGENHYSVMPFSISKGIRAVND